MTQLNRIQLHTVYGHQGIMKQSILDYVSRLALEHFMNKVHKADENFSIVKTHQLIREKFPHTNMTKWPSDYEIKTKYLESYKSAEILLS